MVNGLTLDSKITDNSTLFLFSSSWFCAGIRKARRKKKITQGKLEIEMKLACSLGKPY